MSKIKFTGEADFNRISAEYQKLQVEMGKVEEKARRQADTIERLDRRLSRASRYQSQVATTAADNITRMAAGWLSVSSAISVATRSLVHHQQIQAQAGQATMQLAAAEAGLLRNLTGVSAKDAEAFKQSMRDIAVEAKTGSAVPVLAAGSMVMTKSQGNIPLTKEVVRTIAPFFRSAPEEMAIAAGAITDLVRQSQSDPQRMTGLVLSTQSQAGITKLEGFQHGAPAIISASGQDTGDDRVRAVREAAAMFAGVTSGLADDKGAIGKTAVAALAAYMEALMPEKDVYGPGGVLLRGGTGLKTNRQRIRALQKDEELRRVFWRGDPSQNITAASFRKPVAGVIRQLLGDPNSAAAKAFDSAMENIVVDPEMVQRELPKYDTLPMQAKERAVLGSTARTERYMAKEARAREAAVRKILLTGHDDQPGALAASQGWLNYMGGKWGFEASMLLGNDPVEAALGQVGAAMGRLRLRGKLGALTAEQQETLDYLAGIQDELKQLNNTADRNESSSAQEAGVHSED